MEIKGFNDAKSESLFLFYEEKGSERIFYRISLDGLCNQLGVEFMPAKDVEDTEEFKKYDKKKLVQDSEAYIWYDRDTKTWKYNLQQFMLPYILFKGYNISEFPSHLYRSGKGFSSGFGKILQSGITEFIGKDQVEEIVIDKTEKTTLKKIRNRGFRLIISERDYEILFSGTSQKKQLGEKISQVSIAEFFHKQFPEKSVYDEKSNGKELKQFFISSLNECIIPALTKNELERVEDFFQKIIGTNGGNNNFAQRNFLKIAECNLEIILQEFENLLKRNPKEETWQKFFEKNIFIFDSRYIDFLSKFSVKPGRSSEPDFLVYDIYGYVDVYEIKKSDVELVKYDASHENYYWSADISKAISQLEKYIYNITMNKNGLEKVIKEEKGIDVKIIKPKGVLVIGNRKKLTNDNMVRDFEILRSSLKNIEIILYDEMYERLKNLKISSLKQEQK